MYQFSYAEIMADDVADSKGRERQVLDKAITMLQSAMKSGRESREAVEALYLPGVSGSPSLTICAARRTSCLLISGQISYRSAYGC
jgi:hypothetical protein